MCVLGVGLIGGSLLRRVGPGRGFGWNRGEAGARAAADAGFDVSRDLPAVLREAARRDALVVVGVPMPAVGAVLDAVAEHAPGVALTDVVSVKAAVLDEVRRRGLGARYVGGHPMAGTSESGWAATDPALFEGATWLLATDGAGAAAGPGTEGAGHDSSDSPDPEVFARVAALAGECGSRVVCADAAVHDRAVARISHLPHVLAEALAESGARGGPLSLALAAGSFRDGTRVAGTAPGLVRAICEPNRDALLGVLDECLEALGAARGALAAGDGLGPLVDRGHAGRERYETASGHSTGSGSTGAGGPVTLVPGEPGWADAARDAGARGLAVEVRAPR